MPEIQDKKPSIKPERKTVNIYPHNVSKLLEQQTIMNMSSDEWVNFLIEKITLAQTQQIVNFMFTNAGGAKINATLIKKINQGSWKI